MGRKNGSQSFRGLKPCSQNYQSLFFCPVEAIDFILCQKMANPLYFKSLKPFQPSFFSILLSGRRGISHYYTQCKVTLIQFTVCCRIYLPKQKMSRGLSNFLSKAFIGDSKSVETFILQQCPLGVTSQSALANQRQNGRIVWC